MLQFKDSNAGKETLIMIKQRHSDDNLNNLQVTVQAPAVITFKKQHYGCVGLMYGCRLFLTSFLVPGCSSFISHL